MKNTIKRCIPETRTMTIWKGMEEWRKKIEEKVVRIFFFWSTWLYSKIRRFVWFRDKNLRVNVSMYVCEGSFFRFCAIDLWYSIILCARTFIQPNRFSISLFCPLLRGFIVVLTVFFSRSNRAASGDDEKLIFEFYWD